MKSRCRGNSVAVLYHRLGGFVISSDDIPDLANVAIDNRNQTNPRVVIGLDLLMVKGYGLSKIADIRMQYDLSGFFR
jgi:hypothetical protein